MVVTNRPELRTRLTLLIIAVLLVSGGFSSDEIPPRQNTGAPTALDSTLRGPGGNETSGTQNPGAGIERNRTYAPASAAGNATGSERSVRTSASTPPPEHSVLTSNSRSSIGPEEEERTNGPSTNKTQPPGPVVTENKALYSTERVPKEPRSTQSTQNPGRTSASTPPTEHPSLTPNSTRSSIGPEEEEVGTKGPSTNMTENADSNSTERVPKKPQSTQRTQNPGRTSRTTTSSTTAGKKAHPCPTEEPKKEGMVGRCLMAIALLAALATVFIVSTVVLAAKLSGSRYGNRMRLLQETEMVCISALMNDTEHPVPKPRHPKSNGALLPSAEDEDGDALTLNSFLPDTEGAA